MFDIRNHIKSTDTNSFNKLIEQELEKHSHKEIVSHFKLK